MTTRRRLSFLSGETARVRVTFADEAGVGVTASGVAFSARSPSGAVSSLAHVAESASTYYADVAANAAGDWAVRATCSGPTASAVEVSFTVVASVVV